VSLLRWMSLGAAAAVAGCAAAAAAAFPLLGWPGVVALMMLGAAGVGGALWYTAGLLERDHIRLMDRLAGLGNAHWKPRPMTSRFGLDRVLPVVQEQTAQLRGRVSELAAHRRELEIQARIAEAERQHLSAILNSISDAVIVTDAFNDVALVNGAAGRIFGFDAQAASRRPIDQVVHDPTLLGLIRDTRQSEAAIRRSVDHTILNPSGSEAVYNVNLAAIMRDDDAAGPADPGAAGVVTVLHDVTREREIADAKSDFVANVSHELRTPLTSITAYMEMLIDGEAKTEATRAEFYNVIQGEANRLSRLIDNILNISRIESGVVRIQREELSLPRLAHEVVDILSPQATAKRITLTLEPCPAFFQVFADRDMILQAMLNLVGNAIKYTPEGGRVDVRFEMDHHERRVAFSVKDTGLGIPEADLPHLFDKFYRVANHKGAAKGTGLGLNLVKHVIETVHGGTISVVSEEGKGSTFTFTLPIAESS